MKFLVSVLEGGRLDQAVAKTCGYLYDAQLDEDFIVVSLDPVLPRPPDRHVRRSVCRIVVDASGQPYTLKTARAAASNEKGSTHSFCPSSEWAHGGPIMQSEGISPERHKPDSMDAGDPLVSDGRWMWVTENAYGPTMLVAAMREFVTRKFGEEVDL